MNNQTFSPNTDPEERPKKSYRFLFIAAAFLFVLSLVLIFSDVNKESSKNPPGQGTPSGASLDSLLFAQLPGALSERGLDGLKLDDIAFNEVKDQAVLWMAASDPDTGELLAREPSAILALWNEESGQWNLYQKDDTEFLEKLRESDFGDSEIYGRFTEYDPKAHITGTIYGGFKLPWRGGLTKRLTWSVGHTSCANNYCLYAFDFADGTMFEITAAKSGYVYHFKDSCNNGDSSCTNSITIQDRSTTPYTYHLYLHIAKGSVPQNLRKFGVPVFQGQTIAFADDTGYSTGHHLHFMVIEQGTLNACVNYCWGKSVDITFRDVDINWDAATQGGRPRLASEAAWYGGTGRTYYTSGNTYKPPSHTYNIIVLFK